MSRQDAFISKVRTALKIQDRERLRREALFAPADPHRAKSITDRIHRRSTEKHMQLLEVLIRRAEPLNLPVIPVNGPDAAAAAICRLVHNKKPEWGDVKSVVAWQHPLIEELNLPVALAADQVAVHLPETNPKAVDRSRARMRSQVVESFIGITGADYCLAETATLVVEAGPGRARSISLVPSIHIAVISLDQIIADLTELYALLKQGPNGGQNLLSNCMTFITGPSKTADIELNMVHGAHGPRELHIVVLIP